MTIKQVMAIVVMSLFFLGTGVMAADRNTEQKHGATEQSATGLQNYTDRELQLAFENCQLRIQAAQQQIIDARNLMQQLQAEAKKRQDKTKQGAAGKPEKEVKKTDKPAQ